MSAIHRQANVQLALVSLMADYSPRSQHRIILAN
jgi:hypothetical protein